MKKVTFCKLKTSLSRTLFTIHKHFGDFVACILRFCCRFSMKIIVYLLVNTEKPKLVAFLTAFYDCFICRSNFVFPKCLEAKRHLDSSHKTVNSRGYSELREPIKTREKCYSLNTKQKYTCKPQQCTRDTRQIYKTRLREEQKVKNHKERVRYVSIVVLLLPCIASSTKARPVLFISQIMYVLSQAQY